MPQTRQPSKQQWKARNSGRALPTMRLTRRHEKGVSKAARNTGAFALEPAGEFAGEYFGQGLATGDWDTKGAALEALSSMGQSGITFAGQKFIEYAIRPKSWETTKADQAPSAGTNPLLALPSPTYTGTSKRPAIAAAGRAAAGY